MGPRATVQLTRDRLTVRIAVLAGDALDAALNPAVAKG
jgi:hypothetical protein